METPKEAPKPKTGIFAKLSELFGGKTETAALSWEKHEELRIERALQALYPSDEERRQLVREALQEAFGASDREVIVCDLYSESKIAIFWFMTPMGPMPKGAEYYRLSWTDNADGKPVFAGEPQLVRRQTVYEPIASNAEPAPAPVPATQEQQVDVPELTAAVENLKAAGEKLAAVV